MKRLEALETAASTVSQVAQAVSAHPDPPALVRRASLLPGWTIGHVLTHLARNADSYMGMISAARDGVVGEQYPGGAAQRDGDIQAGAGRSPEELVADLLSSSERLRAAMAGCQADTWEQLGRRWGTQLWPIADLPFLRCREVVLHSSDLGLEAITPDSWPRSYVAHELRRQIGSLAQRLPAGAIIDLRTTDSDLDTIVMSPAPEPVPPVAVSATAPEVLAWIVGRSTPGTGWPHLVPWNGAP